MLDEEGDLGCFATSIDAFEEDECSSLWDGRRTGGGDHRDRIFVSANSRDSRVDTLPCHTISYDTKE